MNKSEQLISCLEGEIAKRDARIVELERALKSERDTESGAIYQLRAELAAIKAQEPVGSIEIQGTGFMCAPFPAPTWAGGRQPAVGTRLYAAPVSEAKAQGVVLDGSQLAGLLEQVRLNDDEAKPHGNGAAYWNNAVIACQVAIRDALAAPVQQVSVPDEMRSLAQRLREYNQNPHHINPMSEAFHILVADAANALSTACVPKEIAAAITWSEHLLFECGALTSTRAPSVHVYNKTFAAVNEARAMIAAAPAAPAADAGLVLEQAMYALIGIGYHENSGLVHELRQSLAAHRAKGVV